MYVCVDAQLSPTVMLVALAVGGQSPEHEGGKTEQKKKRTVHEYYPCSELCLTHLPRFSSLSSRPFCLQYIVSNASPIVPTHTWRCTQARGKVAQQFCRMFNMKLMKFPSNFGLLGLPQPHHQDLEFPPRLFFPSDQIFSSSFLFLFPPAIEFSSTVRACALCCFSLVPAENSFEG